MQDLAAKLHEALPLCTPDDLVILALTLPLLGCAAPRLLQALHAEFDARLARVDGMALRTVARVVQPSCAFRANQRIDLLRRCGAWMARSAAADEAAPGSCRLGPPIEAAKALHSYASHAWSLALLPPLAARALASETLKDGAVAGQEACFGPTNVRLTVCAMAAFAELHARRQQEAEDVQPSGDLFGGMEDDIARLCSRGIDRLCSSRTESSHNLALIMGAMHKLGVPLSAAMAAQVATKAAA